MRKNYLIILSGCLALALVVWGCEQKRAATSKDAIETSESMKTLREKSNYLMEQAKSYYNAKDYEQAIAVSQYVLIYVDENSKEAQQLVQKIQEDLMVKAKKTANGIKNSFKIK